MIDCWWYWGDRSIPPPLWSRSDSCLISKPKSIRSTRVGVCNTVMGQVLELMINCATHAGLGRSHSIYKRLRGFDDLGQSYTSFSSCSLHVHHTRILMTHMNRILIRPSAAEPRRFSSVPSRGPWLMHDHTCCLEVAARTSIMHVAACCPFICMLDRDGREL